MSEKLCIFCVNLCWADSRGHGSSMTGPYGDKGIACTEGHFSEETYINSIEAYRGLILTAKECPDYVEVKL